MFTTIIFGLWTFYVVFCYPTLKNNLTLPPLTAFNEAIRVLIFAGTTVSFLLLVFTNEKPLPFLRLTTNARKGLIWGAAAGLFYASLIVGRAAFFGAENFSPKSVSITDWLTTITVSPFIEEVAFRGFLLQKFEEAIKFSAANVVTALLFVAIHFPRWITRDGANLFPEKGAAMAGIFILGLLLGFLFKRTNSLCGLAHVWRALRRGCFRLPPRTIRG